VVLGLDFGGTKVAVAVCDLQGNRLASATVSTHTDPQLAGRPTAGPQHAGRAGPAQAVFERSIQAARGLLDTAAPGSELAAVGASTFGIPYDDRVELAPAIDGWEDLALGRELRGEFGGVPVMLATDAKAAAAAEWRWGALHDCDPAVYLNLGTGLSAALVAGGQVITGSNGAAGEIGYNLRTMSDVGLSLGQRTMLEDKVSGQALARRASSQRGRAGRLTAADAFAAGTADPALSALIADFTEELAFHLVNLAILVNPVRIAVGGGLVRSWERMAPRLTSALTAGTPFPPELVVARFPYDAPLLGAIALAVDAATAQPAAPVIQPPIPTQDITHVGDVTRIAEATSARQVTGVTGKTMKNNTGAPA
jgi:glucokinase